MGKKLQEKAQLVTGIPSQINSHGIDNPVKAKTAPGTMLQFYGQQSDAIKELDGLREKMKSFEDSMPLKRIDPNLIRPSQWANRHEESFSFPEFKSFCSEIESSGGNIQPIKVREIIKDNDSGFVYEIIFGHRRHRACLNLGLMVLVEIENLSDQELFIQMDRENRQRADLRPYEQGFMYEKALKDGLFPSAKKLAEQACIDLSNLGKALNLVRLPSVVIKSFVSPLDLQYRWAKPLADAIQNNSDAVLSLAESIINESPRPSSANVFKRLIEVGCTVHTTQHSKQDDIRIDGINGQSASICVLKKDNCIVVNLKNIGTERFLEVRKAIQALIS